MPKYFFFILFISLLYSCSSNFEPNNFKGSWIPFDNNGNHFTSPTLTFKKDSIQIEDTYYYVQKGKFKISNNTITYFLKKDTLTFSFTYQPKDSTITIDNYKYKFWEGYDINNSFKGYELAKLEREKKITLDSLRMFSNAFHLFKDITDSIKIKLNDKITSNFSTLKPFSFSSCSHIQIPISIIYIGKEVKLNDILKSYFELWPINTQQAMLITDFNIKTNMYEGYLDTFQLWEEQIELHSKESLYPPIPPQEDNYRKKHLRNHTPKIIKITCFEDFNQLSNINRNENYLIQINTNLSLKTYILLRENISRIENKENIKIRTEFNQYLPNS